MVSLIRFSGLGFGLAMALVLAPSLASAQSNCRTDTITVTGEKKRAIDDATQSAMDAASAEIKKRYGKDWVLGPRRNAKFTCEKWLGGPAARIGWTCRLDTAACKSTAR
jgi:hypothetical protein